MADRSFLEWPFLEERHRGLHARLEGWARRELPALLQEEHRWERDPAEVGRRVRAIAAALAESGLLRIAVGGESNSAGYGKLDVRSLCLCREALARHAGLADFAFAMQGLGSGPISLFGTSEQKQKYLPEVGAGKRLTAFALSEAEAGSDVGAIATTARRDGKHWRLDGSKTWISNAGIADLLVVFARTGDGPGTRGLSAFIVEGKAAGLRVSKQIEVSAPHPIGTLEFDGVQVPQESLLGAPGEGFKVAMATLDVFRSTVGAAALGMARRALDEAAARALKREMFGQHLADFQLTQAKLAEMAVAVDAAALLVYRAAWTKDTRGGRITREASMAKLYATEEAQKVVDQAVQIFGGLGVVRGMAVERLYREVRALRIYEGASEVQKLILGGKVLQAAREESAPEREKSRGAGQRTSAVPEES